MGISDDDVHHIPATEKNLADLLDDNHVSWKLYQEDYPGNCDDDAVIGRYARKHNQFISFDDVRLNATKCSKIVNSDQLDTDLAKNALPQYSYFTPNMDNDAHDTNITYAGKWLDQFFTNRLSKFPDSTLIVVTWDEDDYSEQNKVLTFMLDPKRA
jgi:phospholipase C